MAYSIKKMELEIADLKLRRNALEKLGVNRNAILALDSAIRIIASLAGRLSAAEGLLTIARAEARYFAAGRRFSDD